MSLILYNPIDLLKTRAQADRQQFIKYRQVVPEMFRLEGARGFMKGSVPGLLRDVPGTGVYFWSYHYLKTWLDLHELSEAKGKRGY